MRQGLCFKWDIDRPSCLFHNVNYLVIREQLVKEETGKPFLCDLNSQPGRLLDVLGLLHFVLSVAGKSVLHHGEYPLVLFDVVAELYGIFSSLILLDIQSLVVISLVSALVTAFPCSYLTMDCLVKYE